MSVDVGNLITDPVVQAGTGGFSLAGIFLWCVRKIFSNIEKVDGRVDDVCKKVTETKLDLADHKIYSEGAFAKMATIDRVHQRIDDLGKKSDKILEILINNKG